MKIRYKIRMAIRETRRSEIDALQAQVIMEVLQWSRQHRQQHEPAAQRTAAGSRLSRSRSRSSAGPPPWRCRTPARR